MDGKISAVCSTILAQNTDVFMISESWISDKNGSLVDAHLMSSTFGLTTHHVPRYKRRGGGLALLVRSNIKVMKNATDTFRSMEVLDYNIGSGESLMHVILLYRPPYSSRHKVPLSVFLSELGNLDA